MKSNKPIQCVHKISQFQAHKNCNQLASICQKECQQLHKANDDGILLSVETVSEQFKAIRALLKSQLQQYSQSLSSIYQKIINRIKKQQENDVRQMQKQLLIGLMKNLSIQKSLFDKIDNNRLQLIRCGQLMSLMEETNTQQKMKKTALITIYQKYQSLTHKFTQSLFAGKPIPGFANITSSTPAPKSKQSKIDKAVQTQKQIIKNNINANSQLNAIQQKNLNYQRIIEQKKQQFRQLQSKHQYLKYNCTLLSVEKNNMQRELKKLKMTKPIINGKKLSQKTWSIVKITTKKIKKNIKEPLILEPCIAPINGQPMIQEIQKLPINNNNVTQICHLIEVSGNQIAIEGQGSKNNQHDPLLQVNAQQQIGQQQIVINTDQQAIIQNQPAVEQTKSYPNNLQQIDEEEEDFFNYLRKKKLV